VASENRPRPQQIAAACGFGSTDSIGRAFLRSARTTPHKYHRQLRGPEKARLSCCKIRLGNFTSGEALGWENRMRERTYGPLDRNNAARMVHH
jgi:AraC-like DNA-binding protein